MRICCDFVLLLIAGSSPSGVLASASFACGPDCLGECYDGECLYEAGNLFENGVPTAGAESATLSVPRESGPVPSATHFQAIAATGETSATDIAREQPPESFSMPGKAFAFSPTPSLPSSAEAFPFYSGVHDTLLPSSHPGTVASEQMARHSTNSQVGLQASRTPNSATVFMADGTQAQDLTPLAIEEMLETDDMRASDSKLVSSRGSASEVMLPRTLPPQAPPQTLLSDVPLPPAVPPQALLPTSPHTVPTESPKARTLPRVLASAEAGIVESPTIQAAVSAESRLQLMPATSPQTLSKTPPKAPPQALSENPPAHAAKVNVAESSAESLALQSELYALSMQQRLLEKEIADAHRKSLPMAKMYSLEGRVRFRANATRAGVDAVAGRAAAASVGNATHEAKAATVAHKRAYTRAERIAKADDILRMYIFNAGKVPLSAAANARRLLVIFFLANAALYLTYTCTRSKLDHRRIVSKYQQDRVGVPVPRFLPTKQSLPHVDDERLDMVEISDLRVGGLSGGGNICVTVHTSSYREAPMRTSAVHARAPLLIFSERFSVSAHGIGQCVFNVLGSEPCRDTRLAWGDLPNQDLLRLAQDQRGQEVRLELSQLCRSPDIDGQSQHPFLAMRVQPLAPLGANDPVLAAHRRGALTSQPGQV